VEGRIWDCEIKIQGYWLGSSAAKPESFFVEDMFSFFAFVFD